MSFSNKRGVHYQPDASHATTKPFCRKEGGFSIYIVTTENWWDVNCKRCLKFKPKSSKAAPPTPDAVGKEKEDEAE